MISLVDAILLGLLQGVTELFPISSLGHSVILPALLGWHINQEDPSFTILLVATHTATALVLLGFFANEWFLILSAMLASLRARAIRLEDTYARIGWLLVVATIPAGILGLLFQKPIEKLFATPLYAGVFLFFNGLLLLMAERLRRRSQSEQSGDEYIARLGWSQDIYVGMMQCLALLPGFSRTGATLSGGLLTGLSHEDAARFSFLLATPIIFAASVLKLPELFSGVNRLLIIPVGAAAVASAFAAYLSVRFLTRYFHTRTLIPFAIYCLLAGGFAIAILH